MKIGTYELGQHAVTVFADAHLAGASFNTMKGKMTIGLDGDWSHVVSRLLHESFEMACASAGLRLVPSPDYASSQEGYVFHFSHLQLSEMLAQAGHFMAEAIPALRAAHRKEKR